MATTVTGSSSYDEDVEEIMKAEKEQRDEEFVKEFFTKDLVLIETIILWIERVPILCLIFLSHFPPFFRFAVEMLTICNLFSAIIFISRLMCCPSAIVFDNLFLIERIAFLFTALVYYFEYSRCLVIASTIYIVTNRIRIVNNWSRIWEQIRENLSAMNNWLSIKEQILENLNWDTSSREESQEEEEYEVESAIEDDEPPKKKQAIFLEEDIELIDDIFQNIELTDEICFEEAKDEEKAISYIEEEDNHNGAAFWCDEKCVGNSIFEEENHRVKQVEQFAGRRLEWDEEKKELHMKLDESIEMLRFFQQEKNDLSETLSSCQQEKESVTEILNDITETLISCQKEKKHLAAVLDETLKEKKDLAAMLDQTLKEKKDLRISNLFCQCQVKSQCKPTANPSSAKQRAFYADSSSFVNSGIDAGIDIVAANIDNVANIDNYQSLEEERESLEEEQERNDQTAKLTATAWYRYDVHDDYQLQNQNLLRERDDLSVKLQSANTSAEFYKACLDNSNYECRKLREENKNLSVKRFAETSSAEYYQKLVYKIEEKCRKLEREKNELAANLCAAKAASQLYRSYLHDS